MSTAGRIGRGGSALLLAPLVLLLGVIFFYPIGRLLLGSFVAPDWSLAHYAALASEPLYARILLRTAWIALVVTVLALLLGYPIAYAMSRLKGWQAALVTACVMVPLWTSVLVRSYAWIVLLQRNGLVNTWLTNLGLIDAPLRLIYTEGAVLVAMTHVLLPFMVLPIYASLRGIPPELVRAARNLGAGGLRSFWHVVLPLSLPGVSAGALMVFILALGFYVTPALVGGPRTLMIATLIAQQVTELLNWGLAGALSTVLLILTLGAILVFRRLLGVERIVGHG
ncbi:MAG: ABC transporter permease [Alphaproteobacteria bacterium]|nr:ABC transporter permease [Alphaproteobacteria bacterium]